MTPRDLRAKIMEAGELRYGFKFKNIETLAARLLVHLHEHDTNECDPEVACSSGITFSDDLSELLADIDNVTCYVHMEKP